MFQYTEYKVSLSACSLIYFRALVVSYNDVWRVDKEGYIPRSRFQIVF